MIVRATSNFSINRPDDEDGKHPDNYSRGYVYDVDPAFFDEQRKNFVMIATRLRAEDEDPDDDTADPLKFARHELLTLVRRSKLGLEAPEEMTSKELAQALTENQGPKRGKVSMEKMTVDEILADPENTMAVLLKEAKRLGITVSKRANKRVVASAITEARD